MFRIKICGVRFPQDIQAVADAGGDAIGLNFYPPSVRSLDPSEATTVKLSQAAAERGLMRVGVFVNESPEFIAGIASDVGLDGVQCHGDESIESVQQISNVVRLPIVRAVKLPTGSLTPVGIHEATEPWLDAGCHILLDADAGRQHGGSGKTLDWAAVYEWADKYSPKTWTLAGGLRPENIAEAVAATGASSIDTASGVECPKGVKSPKRIADFVEWSGLTH